MTTEEDKDAVRRCFEALNHRQTGVAAGFWAANSTNFGTRVEREAMMKLLEGLLQVGDRFEPKEIVAEGEWAACRPIASCTRSIRPTIPLDSGIQQPTEPAGRAFAFRHMDVFRTVGRKPHEHTSNRDDLGVARQIGLELLSAGR